MAKAKTKKITTNDLKITIDDMAVVVSNGFKEVATGFKKQRKITDDKIDDLANAMKEGFERQEKMIDDKIDDLARMTKRGFDEAAKNLDVVKNDVHFLKFDVQEIKEKVGNIEKLVFQQHSPKIKVLENKVQYIEEVLTIDK